MEFKGNRIRASCCALVTCTAHACGTSDSRFSGFVRHVQLHSSPGGAGAQGGLGDVLGLVLGLREEGTKQMAGGWGVHGGGGGRTAGGVCAVGMTQALRLAGPPHIWRCPLPHLEVGGAAWKLQRQCRLPPMGWATAAGREMPGCPRRMPGPSPSPTGSAVPGFSCGTPGAQQRALS